MTLVIEHEQDLRTVADLRLTLLAAITPGTPIVLDLSGVTGADLAFVQLIESARIHAAAVGADLSLAGPVPAGLHDVLDRAGFGNAPSAHFWSMT
jgi:anti-anti-sigma regulatory factor